MYTLSSRESKRFLLYDGSISNNNIVGMKIVVKVRVIPCLELGLNY